MRVRRWLEDDLWVGLWDVDRFAAAHNAKAVRFNSLFGTVGTEAVDAFSQSWAEGFSFALSRSTTSTPSARCWTASRGTTPRP